MATSILRFVNQRGIPCIENQSVSLTTTAETFTFNPYVKFGTQFQGMIFIKITGTNTPPSTAVPIQFATEGVSNSSVAVHDKNGTALTTGTFDGDGIYIGFYDSTTGILRLLNI